jgi:hypothetical protein
VQTAYGYRGDIPVNVITWKVIIMPAESSRYFKISWNSWVSSAESTKFVDVVKEVTEAIKALGPNNTFVKNETKAA